MQKPLAAVGERCRSPTRGDGIPHTPRKAGGPTQTSGHSSTEFCWTPISAHPFFHKRKQAPRECVQDAVQIAASQEGQEGASVSF